MTEEIGKDLVIYIAKKFVLLDEQAKNFFAGYISGIEYQKGKQKNDTYKDNPLGE